MTYSMSVNTVTYAQEKTDRFDEAFSEALERRQIGRWEILQHHVSNQNLIEVHSGQV